MAELHETVGSSHNIIDEVDASRSPPVSQRSAANLLPKAVFLAAIAILLPLVPAQAPEFLSETLLNKGWELLHLILVGIAISYGLFSTRNFDQIAEKELPCKSGETPHSCVSDLFHVSEVFNGGRKLKMWSSQYSGEDSTVLVAEKYAVTGGRLLLLPLRSLKRTAEERRAGEEEPPADETTLASPIPWRSRLQSLETETKLETLAPHLGDNSAEFNDMDSRKKQTKKKTVYKPPPRPPPPPPPPSFRNGSLRTCNSRSKSYDGFNGARDYLDCNRCFRSDPDPKSFYKPGRSVRTVKSRDRLQATSASSENWTESSSPESDIVSASEESDEEMYDPAESEAAAEGHDVDKKADEFIAKFREQIRLQRIENMKRASAVRRKT